MKNLTIAMIFSLWGMYFPLCLTLLLDSFYVWVEYNYGYDIVSERHLLKSRQLPVLTTRERGAAGGGIISRAELPIYLVRYVVLKVGSWSSAQRAHNGQRTLKIV